MARARLLSRPLGLLPKPGVSFFSSGQRRPNDVRMYSRGAVVMVFFCIDVAHGPEAGDVAAQSAGDKFLAMLWTRQALGGIGGPPCITWCKGRANPPPIPPIMAVLALVQCVPLTGVGESRVEPLKSGRMLCYVIDYGKRFCRLPTRAVPLVPRVS